MTNVFVSDPDPVVAAQALDNKRLLRMCLEAYDALCGALATHRYGPRGVIPDHDDLPHRPLPRFRSHNVIKWTGADGLHYRWVLAHAQALQLEARYRSNRRRNCAMYERCNAYCVEHAHEIPTRYPAGTTLRDIEFYGAFNYNEFRWTYSAPHKGQLALPQHVNIFDRYRLSLLHKWQWTDVRPSVFGPRGAPWWAADELFDHFLQRTFGPPVSANVELKPNAVRSAAGFQERFRRVVGEIPAIAIAERPPLALAHAAGGTFVISVAPATRERPAGSALFANYTGEQSHRLVLTRTWDATLPPLVVCMLNPSTADAFVNDPTVGRVETVAARLRARGLIGGYVVVNWASVRATDPADAYAHPDPVGEHNLDAIRATLEWVRQTWLVRPIVLAAWGAGVKPLDPDGNSTRSLMRVLRRWRSRVVALHTTKDGHPGHPLYLSGTLRLKPYADRPQSSKPSRRDDGRRAQQRTVQRGQRNARRNASRQSS